MDYGKHVTSANNISLAIMALGFTALYAVWVTSENDQTILQAYHQEPFSKNGRRV